MWFPNYGSLNSSPASSVLQTDLNYGPLFGGGLSWVGKDSELEAHTRGPQDLLQTVGAPKPQSFKEATHRSQWVCLVSGGSPIERPTAVL